MVTFQAARLTRIGSKLRQISFETRVFGYQNCSMLELDSFVLFVNGATLRVSFSSVISIQSKSIELQFPVLNKMFYHKRMPSLNFEIRLTCGELFL